LYPISQASVFGFFAAIGTIDGKHPLPRIHSIGAVFFFILLFVVALNVTLLVRDIYKWDPSVISYKSKLMKTIIIVVLTIVVGYCVLGVVVDSKNSH